MECVTRNFEVRGASNGVCTNRQFSNITCEIPVIIKMYCSFVPLNAVMINN